MAAAVVIAVVVVWQFAQQELYKADLRQNIDKAVSMYEDRQQSQELRKQYYEQNVPGITIDDQGVVTMKDSGVEIGRLDQNGLIKLREFK